MKRSTREKVIDKLNEQIVKGKHRLEMLKEQTYKEEEIIKGLEKLKGSDEELNIIVKEFEMEEHKRRGLHPK